ncbi:MAG: Fn3-like domain-containing protein [Gilvibacter sp.]
MITSQITLSRGIRLLAILTTFLVSEIAYSQSCDASLVLEGNKNVGSADEDGTQFVLIVKNESNTTQNYQLNTNFLAESCASANKANVGENIPLDVHFKSQLNSTLGSTRLTLSPNQSQRINIDIQVPQGSSYNRWSCIQLELASEQCSNLVATQLLRVFVPDPTEE